MKNDVQILQEFLFLKNIFHAPVMHALRMFMGAG
jgi:hypothetical protein